MASLGMVIFLINKPCCPTQSSSFLLSSNLQTFGINSHPVWASNLGLMCICGFGSTDCLTLKVLFGLPLRQTTGFIASLLKLVGLDWSVPDFSTLCRRQKALSVAIPYKGSAGPLHLLIDSTGIKAEGEGEWNARKHGGPKRRLWRKIHIGIDEQTLEIRAIEVTSSSIGDAPILPDLLNQIPPDQELGSVTADGAYDTRKCHDAIAA